MTNDDELLGLGGQRSGSQEAATGRMVNAIFRKRLN